MTPMSEQSGWYTVRTALIAGSLPVAGLITTFLDARPSVELATQVLGYFIWAATFVSARHLRARLVFERLKRFLLNTTCRWSFAARFELPPEPRASNVLDAAVRQLLALRGSKLLSRDQTRAHVHVDGTTISARLVQVSVDAQFDETPAAELVIELLETPTPYRHLRAFFDQRLDPLVEEVRKVVGSHQQKYELMFGFPADSNPYFGLMVRQLRPQGEFGWRYSEKTKQNGTLVVTADRLELATFNAAELRAYFRRFVALSLEGAPPR